MNSVFNTSPNSAFVAALFYRPTQEFCSEATKPSTVRGGRAFCACFGDANAIKIIQLSIKHSTTTTTTMMPLSSLPVDLLEHVFEDDLSFASDVESIGSSDDESSPSDDEDDSSTTDFILDIGFLERDTRFREEFQRRRRERRSAMQEGGNQQQDEEDPLETDSLKLIRKRVPQQERLPEGTTRTTTPSISSSSSPVVSKKFDMPLSFQVCEVPLGVSLKSILPSAFRMESNFQAFFPSPGSNNNGSVRSSEDLIDGIDKALEIVSLTVQDAM